MNTFYGFHEPESNWSKLPHEFIEAFPLIDTLGEAKVILYILRHTWGYGDEEKKITMDEFIYGRKRRNGTRIDQGTGLTAPTIRAGLAQAVAHGFIVVHTDDSDLARIKHYYALKPFQGERIFPPDSESGGKILSPTPKETFPLDKETYQHGKESLQRSEKETIRKIPLKEKEKGSLSAGELKPEISPAQLWHAARAELQLQMTKSTFDTHLVATEVVSLENGVLTISTRREISLYWLNERLKSMVERTLYHCAGGNVEVKFVLKENARSA